jgi:hypothetical protein
MTRRMNLWIGTYPNPSEPYGGVVQPAVVQVRGKDDVGNEELPFISMETEDAQALIDELWRAGLRPTEGSGSAGSLAATERHLADSRAVMFGLLASQGVVKP